MKNTKYENLAGFIYPVRLKNFTYSDLFKIGNDGAGYFVIKIRDRNRKDVRDSINILKTASDSENFINKIVDVFEKEGSLVMVSAWIDGIQPIDEKRNYLPLFFSRLANFNKRNRGKAPFTSMYADGHCFNTVGELTGYESGCHLKNLRDFGETKLVEECLDDLKRSLACTILEDMNTGNLIISGDGELRFIDTEWIINGSNLYQFEKIDYFGFEERKWYNINDESGDCYAAYFDALGLRSDEANAQIRAFELLQVLRQNSYLKSSGPGSDDEIRRRIKIVLAREKFI